MSAGTTGLQVTTDGMPKVTHQASCGINRYHVIELEVWEGPDLVHVELTWFTVPKTRILLDNCISKKYTLSCPWVQILDVLDGTGSGDVDTSTVVRPDDDGCIMGLHDTQLRLNSEWANPSGGLPFLRPFTLKIPHLALARRLVSN